MKKIVAIFAMVGIFSGPFAFAGRGGEFSNKEFHHWLNSIELKSCAEAKAVTNYIIDKYGGMVGVVRGETFVGIKIGDSCSGYTYDGDALLPHGHPYYVKTEDKDRCAIAVKCSLR